MKRLVWLLCVPMILTAQQVAPAGFAPSEELNKDLPDWLKFSGEYRARLEGFTGGGFKPNNDDAYLLSRLRLNLLIKPTNWLKFYGQAQDARVFWKNQNPPAPPYQNTLDLRQAYVELGDAEKGPLSARVGRQELNYGDQRLVGSLNWTNTARTFDAALVRMRYGPIRLDGFVSSVVVPLDGQMDHHQQGNNFDGLYGGIDKLVPGGVIEPYVFWRLGPRSKNELGLPGKLHEKTGGVRWVGKLPWHLDYGMEVVKQSGTLGAGNLDAWAGHWVMGYTISELPYKPRITVEYNFASGDKNSKDGTKGTFDQLFPTGHEKTGLADQVGWQNIRDLRSSIEVKPRKKLAVSGVFHSWWLDSATDALYTTSGAVVARKLEGSAGTHVGEELDVFGAYNFNPRIVLGFGFGHIFPGEFLQKATPGKPYNFPYIMANYAF